MKVETFTPPEPFQPSVGTSYSIAWKLMKKYFLELLLIIVISIAVQIPLQFIIKSYEIDLPASTIFLGLIGFAFSILNGIPITYGIDYVNLKLLRGEKFDVADVFASKSQNS